MNIPTPQSLVILRAIFGYLLIGTIGLNLWLSWLANHTTSTAIGIGLFLMMVSVSALAVGAALLFLESLHVKKSRHHTPARGIALIGAAGVAAVSVVAAVAVTYLNFITDASRGFFMAAADYPPATALWCLTLLSLAAWVSLMAVSSRSSAATGNTCQPKHTRT